MGIDWDANLLGPVMDVFGEGDPADETSWLVYRPRAGIPFSLQGAVFDAEYHRLVEMGDGSEVSTTHTVMGVRASLFSEPPKQGDLIDMPTTTPGYYDTTYSVLDVQPDGHGHILLILGSAAYPLGPPPAYGTGNIPDVPR